MSRKNIKRRSLNSPIVRKTKSTIILPRGGVRL